MANISNKYISELMAIEEILTPFRLKKQVLGYLFRDFSFVNQRDEILSISVEAIKEIAAKTHIARHIVGGVVRKFLVSLFYFKKFLSMVQLPWDHDLKQLYRKMRIYLHKLYRLAPVFDYRRAKTNLEVLHQLLKLKCYWPRISSQIAMVVFITDRNDPTIKDKNYILQKNLRVFCNCSAYAFHSVRNRLGIKCLNKKIEKTRR